MGDDVMSNTRKTNTHVNPGASQTLNTVSELQRRLPFARSRPFDEPALSGLFALLRETLDKDTRIELSRFARDRLRSAFPAGSGKSGEVPLANGLRVHVDLGDSFGAEFMVGHLNEYDLLDAVIANIPHGAKIVDVGANFGLYALHAAWAAGPESRAVAFEPLPSAGRLLQKSLKTNALSEQIRFVASAVGAESGKANFYIAEDGAFSGLHDTKRSRLAETIEVPVTSLDASPDVAALGPIDFLKVDVEGHEGAVLAGARKLLEMSSGLLAVLEFTHKNLTETGRIQIISELQACATSGFQIWLHDDTGVREVAKIAENFSGNASATVIIAGRDCAWAGSVVSAMETAADKRARSELAQGLQPLLMAVRDARKISSQAEVLSGRFGAGLPASQALQEAGHLLGEQQAKIKALAARIESLEAHAESLQLKLDERLTAFQNMAAQRSDHEAALKSIIERGSAELAAARERADNLSTQLDTFRKAAEAQHEKLVARTKAMEAANGEVSLLRGKFVEAGQKISWLEAERLADSQAANEIVESLKAAIGASNERIAQLEAAHIAELHKANEDAENLKAEIAAAYKRITRIEAARLAESQAAHAEAEKSKAEVSAAVAKISDLENLVASLSNELEARRTMIRQLRQREALLRLGKHKF